MTVADLLTDAFDRIREEVHNATDNLSKDELAFRVDGETNSIAWLIWHLTRIQDDHIAGVTGTEQVWTSRGWADRFGLPFGPMAHGYGHSSEEVAAVQVGAELLTGYHDEVFEATTRYVQTLTDDDLPRVVDDSWDPPVTLGVRIVSVISDDLQHVGQAALIRGIIMRR
jgi:uncharacterized damage-inducible protein DinB